MRILVNLLLLAVFLVGVLFTSANTAPVDVDYYLGSRQMPLAVALLIALVIGVLLSSFAGIAVSLKYRAKLRQSDRQVKKLDKELENLRALPVRDNH
ncbi:MAG: LapA family protein [Gammaproteobacteria bacterium]|nr:MAG: LapA family protein [Gammaproteobacteria bacterium]RLA15898.1 MAG: LapA family protein [Gammaproteobacteria bacterium]RLA17522.1 MAG: LapA family protein [Gammaproteobacteria bacterium]